MNTQVRSENTSQKKERIFEAVSMLKQLCGVKNYKSSRSGVLNLTPRAQFITEALEFMELEYELESFVYDDEVGNTELIFSEAFKALENSTFFQRKEYGIEVTEEDGTFNASFSIQDLYENGIIKDLVPTYHNIVVKFEASEPTEDAIIFTAHHDIVNPASDNCQDNTASVVNLLDLARRLKEESPKLSKNVYIIFLDCEETGGRGAVYNGDMIQDGHYGNVKFIANSELTAWGDTIWMEAVTNPSVEEYVQKVKELVPNVVIKGCPPNDAGYYRMSGTSQAVCFGILPSEEVREPYPPTWRVCHSVADEFRATPEDMANYVDFLFKLINA